MICITLAIPDLCRLALLRSSRSWRLFLYLELVKLQLTLIILNAHNRCPLNRTSLFCVLVRKKHSHSLNCSHCYVEQLSNDPLEVVTHRHNESGSEMSNRENQ